jgi:hypothetical protein
VTVIVAVISGRIGGLFSTSLVEASGSVAGARHAQESKWCVPGVLGVAAAGSLRRRRASERTPLCSRLKSLEVVGVLVVESPMYLIAFSHPLTGCFLQKTGLIFK